jgi:hypothetical protein
LRHKSKDTRFYHIFPSFVHTPLLCFILLYFMTLAYRKILPKGFLTIQYIFYIANMKKKNTEEMYGI